MTREKALALMGLSESSKPPKSEPTFNYTGHGWEGKNYDIHLDIKEIASKVKKSLKKLFPRCRFSVTFKRNSGGKSLTVSLMSASFEPFINNLEFIRKHFKSDMITPEKLLESQEEGHIDINYHYGFNGEYNQYDWDSGAFLTEECFNVLKTAITITQSFNFNDSDARRDYSHTNFYLHIEIGKWNKPFKKT